VFEFTSAVKFTFCSMEFTREELHFNILM
jgi:hypothetical protein